MTDSRIVAGYDGSAGAEQAIAWAAREARSRGSALTVCLAQSPAYPAAPAAARDAETRRAAEEALAPGVQLARDLMAGGEVRSVVAAEPPARALCEQSADAEMVAVKPWDEWPGRQGPTTGPSPRRPGNRLKEGVRR